MLSVWAQSEAQIGVRFFSSLASFFVDFMFQEAILSCAEIELTKEAMKDCTAMTYCLFQPTAI